MPQPRGHHDDDREQREDDWRKAVILMASATENEMLDPKLPATTLLHRLFHADVTALHSAQRDARARALHAVFEATEARRASEHFREMAHRDALTGLYNRRYVNEQLPVSATIWSGMS